MSGTVDYDEFGLFGENAAEYGLPFDHEPAVRRAFAEVAPGRRLSALAMALGRPLVAIDLPGHGHSDGPGESPDGPLDAYGNAADVAVAVRHLAPSLRRGILHNAEQQPDGTWVWRWARAVLDHRAGAARPGHAAGLGTGR